MPKQNSGINTIHGALHINFGVIHNGQMHICLAPGMLLNFILDLEFNLLLKAFLGMPCLNKIQKSIACM